MSTRTKIIHGYNILNENPLKSLRIKHLTRISTEITGNFGLVESVLGAIATGVVGFALGLAAWSEIHLYAIAAGAASAVTVGALWGGARGRSAVRPYIVSAAAAATAVTGIGLIAEIELWTAMHARVTGFVMVLTVALHYCWLNYLWADRLPWFFTLMISGAITGAAMPVFIRFASWTEIHFYVTAGGMVGFVLADILWHLWCNADHRVAERERRWAEEQAAAAKVEADRKAELAAKEAAEEKARQEAREARRFESGYRVQLRWSDETRKHIESIRISIAARDPEPRFRGLRQRIEVEDATPAEVIALVEELREEGIQSAKLLERGLDAKRPRWWLEYERKEVATPWLVVTLNVERTRGESAVVREGPFMGKPLAALTRQEFGQLLEVLDREDRRGAQFARQIFQQTRSGRRGERPRHTSEETPVEGRMTVDQARDFLEVDENATIDAITKRAKMFKQLMHPDKNGSAMIFRMVTEAEALLVKHHEGEGKR